MQRLIDNLLETAIANPTVIGLIQNMKAEKGKERSITDAEQEAL